MKSELFKGKVFKNCLVKFKLVLQVSGPANQDDGHGGGMVTYGYYTDFSKAEIAKKGKGVFGTDGVVSSKYCMVVSAPDENITITVPHEYIYVLDQSEKEEKDLNSALEKLTMDERDALKKYYKKREDL